MKINIGISIKPLSGYVNVDPVGGDGKVCSDFRNLDHICEDSECYEIRAENILNNIHASEIANVLTNWTRKLRHSGKIVIGGYDIFEVCKNAYLRQFDISDVNKILYNPVNHASFINSGMYECSEIAEIMENLGLKVIKKRVNGIKFVVEAYRD